MTPSLGSTSSAFFRAGCLMLAALLAGSAVAPWPTWWANLLVYHGEPEVPWRLLLGLSAAGLLALGILYRPTEDAAIAADRGDGVRRQATFALLISLLWIAAAVPRSYWPADWVKLGAPDNVEYALGAHNLLERGTYAIELNGRPYPPRYPYGYSTFFVAPVLMITGSEPRHAVYASLVSGTLVVVLLGVVGWRAFGAVTSAGGVFLLLVYPLFLKYTREVFADVAVTALFLGVFLAALCLRPSRMRWSAVGLLIGLAASVKFSLVLAAVFPWLAVRLPEGADAKADPPKGRFPRLVLDVCLATGIAVGLAPLLTYNARTFGEPLRTGYHYWCSVPYDFSGLTFSLRYLWQSVDGGGPGNVAYYLLPGGEMAEKAPYHVIQVAYWLLVLAGLFLGWRTPGTTGRAVRLIAAGGALQFAYFAVYFFRSTRLLLPVYVLFLPVAVYALVRLVRVPLQLERSRAVAVCLASTLAIGCWFLGWRYKRFQPDYRNALTAEANRLLPDDALIVSDLDGAYVTHYLLRGTRREYLPLDRGVEYASKFAQPRRPPSAERPTDDPFDHRAIPAEDWNAVEVYPLTALDNPDLLKRRLEKGQPCYAVLEDPRADRTLRSNASRFRVYLERVEPGIGVFRATYSLTSD